jgi:signal transduction histidine kinase/CheY-like chemotaxis protein/CHASE3 domain sensor protein
MKRIRIEIQVILLTAAIAAAVVVSGWLVYQSLSRMVDTIHREARPDLKLLLVKEISSDLNEVENTVRLYRLTGDHLFLKPYRKLNQSVRKKISELTNYAQSDSAETTQIDSIRQLTDRKLLILDEIRALHHAKASVHDSAFTKLATKLDTAIVVADTIVLKPEPKKGFFKRLFGKRDTTKRSIIIDKTAEKNLIRQEIAGTEKSMADQARQMQERDKSLLQQNIRVTKILYQIISRIEISEQKRLETKTQEADILAEKTYNRLAAFTIAAVVLLLLVVVLVVRNVRQNRAYQRALKKAKAEAESLARARETFVATVTHEMRTPVNVINGLTEQLLQKNLPETVSADLAVIHKSAGHLISMVNDTLDFSRIEAQKLKIEAIDFQPDEVLREVIALNKQAAAQKGITLVASNRLDSELVLKGDPFRLKQILINLISNAIKFTTNGQVTVTASGEGYAGKNFLLKIEVADTGTGISKADQERIFDEFVQLDTDLAQKQRGTGLGLAIVKKLIERQNGKIEVDSIPGKGTRFLFRIPYPPGSSLPIPESPVGQPDIPGHFKKLRVLVVDDEEFNRYLIRNILQKWGVSHTEAQNGREAAEIATQKTFDLILLDIRMPVMDGYEAAAQIRKIQPRTKIVALTAHKKTPGETATDHSGIHLFLQKPFTEIQLFDAIVGLIPRDNSSGKNSTGTQTLVDLDELERMSGGDQAFFVEMLQIFIRSGKTGIETIQTALKSEDWDTIAGAAHKLAAPAKHLNAGNLYARLKDLEQACNPGANKKVVEQLVQTISTELLRITAYLEQKLAGS